MPDYIYSILLHYLHAGIINSIMSELLPRGIIELLLLCRIISLQTCRILVIVFYVL